MNILPFAPVLFFVLIPIISPLFGLGWEQIKIFSFVIISCIVAVFFFRKKRKFLSTTNIQISFFVWLIVLFVTSILGNNFEKSLFGVSPYYQGLLFYFILFIFFLVVSTVKITLTRWLYAFAIGTIIISSIALKDWVLIHIFEQNILTYGGRPISTFGQPNFYAGFLLLAIPFLLFPYKQMHRTFQLITLFLSSIAIVCSESRVAITLLIFIFFIYLFLRGSNFLRMVILFASMGVLTFVQPMYQKLLQKEFFESQQSTWLNQNSPDKRIYYWQIGYELIKEKPLFGYGVGNISRAYTHYFESINFNAEVKPALHSLKNIKIESFHNWFLDIFIQSGITGVCSWMVLVILAIKKALIRRAYLLVTSLLIYLIWIQFHNQSVVHLFYMAWVLGIIDNLAVDIV